MKKEKRKKSSAIATKVKAFNLEGKQTWGVPFSCHQKKWDSFVVTAVIFNFRLAKRLGSEFLSPRNLCLAVIVRNYKNFNVKFGNLTKRKFENNFNWTLFSFFQYFMVLLQCWLLSNWRNDWPLCRCPLVLQGDRKVLYLECFNL